MTPDQFFAKFALFADTPNAVAKMRELILNLAVRGKLVPQDVHEDSPAELYRRITAEKERLVAAKSIRKEEQLDVIVAEEELFTIPDSWIWVRCGGLCYPISSGTTPPQSVFSETNGIPFLKVYNIRNQSVDFEYKNQFIDSDYHEIKMKRSILRPGDVIMNIVCPPLGKVAIVPAYYTEWNCNQAIVFFRPIEPLLAKYIYIFIREGSFLKNIQLIGSAGQDNISVTKCKNIPIALPPLAEQKRIVAKVDELMALCDQLESQQKQRETKKAPLVQAALTRFTDAPTPSNLEFLFHKSYAIDPAELRKTILTLAVTGRIVTQDYTDESAHDMLLRMSLSNGVDDGVRNKFLDVDLPQNWTKILFEEVAQIASGVTLGRKLGDRRTVTLPYLRVANVKRGEIDISDVKTVAIGEDEIERFALRAGDLLMIEGGDWDKVGRAAIWRGEIPNCLHQNHVFRVRMRTSELLPVWFERYINSPIGRRYFENAAKQTTNLASINMRQVRACPIPLPPLAEQKRIVAKVEELMSLV